MKKLTILISDKGTGSNLQAIIDAQKSGKIDAKIVSVISDTPKAPGIKRAKENKIPVLISKTKNDLLKTLNTTKPDFVVLAGWKQFILDQVIDTYKNKILNLHPGLIPHSSNSKVINPDGSIGLWNKGLLAEKAIQNFLDSKATYAGSSVHFLTHEFDFGPVLAKGFVKIKKGDTVKSLYKRLKEKEHEIYVHALQKVINYPRKATVLVVDGGGRGSALVDAYDKSKFVSKIIAVPGNDLMKLNVKKPFKIFPQYKTTDIDQIIKIAKTENADLIDVAQDDAVAAGLTDLALENGFKVFGPTKLAGQIEWDKAWARDFMNKNKIPIPAYKVCKSEKEGIEFINKQKDKEWFVKASGLAAGKGVIYAKDDKEAREAISQMKTFGKSGKTFLIEECLNGEEFSSFALVDEEEFLFLGHAQDHKRVFDGDAGPNTGGMGCSSTPLVITKKVEKQIESIFQKTTNGLVKMGRPYRGILYLGGMINKSGKVFVIEFNARWGDPEAQVVIPSIKNDLFELESQVLNGHIKEIKLKKDNLYRIVVTAAAKGYPGDYSKAIGKKIKGLESTKGVRIFGAGVKKSSKNYLVSGGRLFYVMAEAKDVIQARGKAYNALSKVEVEGNNLHYRTDIGYRDVNRINKK